MKILILGSRGMLGSILKSKLNKNRSFCVYTDYMNNKRIDLTKKINLKRLILSEKFKLIINCSGMTDIEECEINKLKSFKINTALIKNILSLKKIYNLKFKLIHFSSDQLYNSNILLGNTEKDINFNANIYSKHKIISEKICKKDNLVFRTNLIGRSISKKKSFTDWVYENIKKNKKFYGFIDSFYSPISMNSISSIIIHIIKKKKLSCSGVYNLGSVGYISKFDLIIAFSKYLGFKNLHIVKPNLINNICKTKRSNYNQMNVLKFSKKFSVKLPKLFVELKKVAKEYEQKN